MSLATETPTDAIDQGHDPAAASEREQEAAAPASTRDVLNDIFDRMEKGEQPATGEKPRDEATGRFAAKVAEPAKSAEPAAVQQAAAQPPEVPASWKGGRESLWQGATPELRQAILDREAEMTRGVERFKGLAPYAQHAERSGLTLSDMLSNYARAETMLATDFPGAIQYLAGVYGYDLSQLGNAIAKAGVEAKTEQPAFPKFNELEGRLGSIEQSLRGERLSRAEAEVAAFANDPKHKHFREVEADVGQLLALARQRGDNLSLTDAYEKAIWANPTVRAKVLADQKAQEVAASAKATTAAKTASRSISSTSPRSQPAAQETTRDVVSRLYDELVGA